MTDIQSIPAKDENVKFPRIRNSKILCSLSGVIFKCTHMNLNLTSREVHHPIFSLDTSTLLGMQDQYHAQEFSPVENYLYYLALWNTTGLVEFHTPARQCKNSIVSSNINSLIHIVTVIHTLSESVVRTKLCLPRFSITNDTSTLENSKYWLEVWEANYTDYKQNYKNTNIIAELNSLEQKLEKRIRNHNDPVQYSGTLASWAEKAGEFHTDLIYNAQDIAEPANEYWKRIIRDACKGEIIYYHSQEHQNNAIEDIDILLEWCIDNIDAGSIQAHILFSLLREYKDKQQTYLSFGSKDITGAFTILGGEDNTVEQANLMNIILNAPKTEPRESEYPNKTAFKIARMAWKRSVDYHKEHPVPGEASMITSLDSSSQDSQYI